MHRRQLLITLALGGAFCVGWAGRARALLMPAARRSPSALLLALLNRPDSAAVVGRAYLRGHPAEADEVRLAEQLATVLRRQDCDVACGDVARLRAALARQIRTDFAQGQVVRVDGWVLSVSEARLCALAALNAPLA